MRWVVLVLVAPSARVRSKSPSMVSVLPLCMLIPMLEVFVAPTSNVVLFTVMSFLTITSPHEVFFR